MSLNEEPDDAGEMRLRGWLVTVGVPRLTSANVYLAFSRIVSLLHAVGNSPDAAVKDLPLTQQPLLKLLHQQTDNIATLAAELDERAFCRKLLSWSRETAEVAYQRENLRVELEASDSLFCPALLAVAATGRLWAGTLLELKHAVKRMTAADWLLFNKRKNKRFNLSDVTDAVVCVGKLCIAYGGQASVSAIYEHEHKLSKAAKKKERPHADKSQGSTKARPARTARRKA